MANKVSAMASEIKFDINTLVRKNVAQMKPYSSARDEFKGEAEVFLDANENPYPTSFNRYPDPLQWKVKEKLAPLKGVRPQQIFLGNGSDEPIDLLIRAFCEPNRDSILITEPTYGMYSVCAEVNAVKIVSVPLNDNFDIDLEAMIRSLNPSIKLIFLCSPNNPSANLLTREKVYTILRAFSGIVVVDEAYIDFAKSKSFVDELDEYKNLVVLQTFSKAWGLAALRCGMAYASEEIIRILNKIKYPYNINIQTQQLVLDALDHADQKNEWVSQILQQRDKLVNELKKLTVVEEVYPTNANFVLAKVKDAPSTYKFLQNQKIIVRDRSKVRLCQNCLRITVGTPSENDILIKTLKTLA
jgi:histidinol-phosphate aminotransferase